MALLFHIVCMLARCEHSGSCSCAPIWFVFDVPEYSDTFAISQGKECLE